MAGIVAVPEVRTPDMVVDAAGSAPAVVRRELTWDRMAWVLGLSGLWFVGGLWVLSQVAGGATVAVTSPSALGFRGLIRDLEVNPGVNPGG